MSELKASDIAGNPLKIGSLVEYVNTGTKELSLKLFQMKMGYGRLSIRQIFAINRMFLE